jgi:hypothetical protein
MAGKRRENTSISGVESWDSDRLWGLLSEGKPSNRRGRKVGLMGGLAPFPRPPLPG